MSVKLLTEHHLEFLTLKGGHKGLLYLLFSLEKKGVLFSYQSRSVVRPCVRPSVTFLVNVSPPKPLEVATSNFVVE